MKSDTLSRFILPTVDKYRLDKNTVEDNILDKP